MTEIEWILAVFLTLYVLSNIGDLGCLLIAIKGSEERNPEKIKKYLGISNVFAVASKCLMGVSVTLFIYILIKLFI